MDAYKDLDLSLNKTIRLWARGDNLLAQKYQINDGYPMPRATFMVGLNLLICSVNVFMMSPKIIDLAKFIDPRGNLSVIEENKDIPFKIERTYWIYDVPGGEHRGGHAYKENQEFIVALSGSFDVILDDGKEKKIYHLNRSYYGLYVPKGLWREMDNFSTNSLALILSSTKYDVDDYIRDYDEFKRIKG